MRTIKIPVEGLITVDEREGDLARYGEAAATLFGPDALAEQVRFGVPFRKPPTQFVWHDMGVDHVIVMLVHESGQLLGQPVNDRASVLYRCGDVHDGLIYGDAYLCLSVRDEMDGDRWGDLPNAYSNTELWDRFTSGERQS